MTRLAVTIGACGLVASMATAEQPAWQFEGMFPNLAEEKAKAEKEFVFPASLANEPELNAKVVYVGGMPKIELNGKLMEPTINQSEMLELPRLNAAIKAHSLGLVINQFIYRPWMIEKAPGVYDFSHVEADMKRLLRFCPNGYALLSVNLGIPKWIQQHPEAQIQYANGPVDVSGKPGDERIARLVRPSAASAEYRAEAKRMLVQLADYIKSRPWGKRVLAIRPCWGIYTEWHTYGFYEGPDVGPSMVEAFHKFQGGRWANAMPPSWEERVMPKGAFTLDPVRDARQIAYYQCMQEVVSDYMLELARLLKTVLPGRLVGMYYGYIFTTHPAEGSNVMLDKVLASPDIDFLTDPSAYSPASRLAGGSYYHRTIPATYTRYRKLNVIEDDMRHYPILNAKGNKHQAITTRDPREATMTTRRNWINMYFDGCGIQILDPEGGDRSKRPFSFDALPIWQAMHDSQRVLRKIGDRPDCSRNATAVVIDWRERLRRCWRKDAYGDKLYVRSIEGIYASGVPVDIMTLDDYLAAPKGRYSRAVFINIFNPEPAMATALEKKLAAEGVRSSWFLRQPFAAGDSKVLSEVPTTGEAWRKMLVELGEKPYVPAGHYVRRHGDVVMFHTGKAGEWTIDLSEYRGATELYSGRKYDSGKLTFTTDGADTLVFKFYR